MPGFKTTGGNAMAHTELKDGELKACPLGTQCGTFECGSQSSRCSTESCSSGRLLALQSRVPP